MRQSLNRSAKCRLEQRLRICHGHAGVIGNVVRTSRNTSVSNSDPDLNESYWIYIGTWSVLRSWVSSTKSSCNFVVSSSETSFAIASSRDITVHIDWHCRVCWSWPSDNRVLGRARTQLTRSSYAVTCDCRPWYVKCQQHQANSYLEKWGFARAPSGVPH